MNKDNQPTCQIDESGNKFWILNGEFHRGDKPAIEWADGAKSWYHHGYLHRLNGPAIEHFNGNKFWYYYGEKINVSSQEEFERLIKLKALW